QGHGAPPESKHRPAFPYEQGSCRTASSGCLPPKAIPSNELWVAPHGFGEEAPGLKWNPRVQPAPVTCPPLDPGGASPDTPRADTHTHTHSSPSESRTTASSRAGTL